MCPVSVPASFSTGRWRSDMTVLFFVALFGGALYVLLKVVPSDFTDRR
jgi:hypothetical protein